jgi:hypothetical protein
LYPVITECPVCGGQMTVRRLQCRRCDTSMEGYFDQGRLGRLSREQIAFVEAFVRCEGKLNRLEKELSLSYPTLRSRLTEIIRKMGYEVGPEEAGMDEETRHRILDDLARGEITSDEAMRLLKAE